MFESGDQRQEKCSVKGSIFSNRIFLPNKNAKAKKKIAHAYSYIVYITNSQVKCNAFETILSLCRRFIELPAHPLAKPQKIHG